MDESRRAMWQACHLSYDLSWNEHKQKGRVFSIKTKKKKKSLFLDPVNAIPIVSWQEKKIGEAIYMDGGGLENALGLEFLGNWLWEAHILEVLDGGAASSP